MKDKNPIAQQASSPESEPGTPPDPSRRAAVRHTISYLLAGTAIVALGALKPRRAYAYYGKCYYCNCCQFMGSENTCSNCGHSYENHSGQTC